MKKLFTLLGVSILLIACEKEEDKLPGSYIPDRVGYANMLSQNGVDYRKQIYFDLSTNQYRASNDRDQWDLALGCDPQNPNLFVNSAILMRIAPTGVYDIHQSFNPQLYKDDLRYERADNYFFSGEMSADFNNNLTAKSQVYLIDMGLDLQNNSRGYWMLQLNDFDSNRYKLKISRPDGSDLQQIEVVTNELYNNVYLSFNNPDSIMLIEPPKQDWDFLFTKYMEKLYDGLDSVDYSVTGCLINPYKTQAYLDSASLRDTTVSFYDLTQNNIIESLFTDKSNVVGYDWKFFDLNGTGRFNIAPHKHYFIRDNSNTHYRLRFTGFYDESGNKGAVSFEYLEL